MRFSFVADVLAVLLLTHGAVAGTATYVVAPLDHPSVRPGARELGTMDAPFTTLEAARDALRRIPNGQTKEVVLRGGTYYLSRTFILDERDAGTEDAPVIYRAYENESPLLIGGIVVPDSAFEPTKLPSGTKGGVKANLFKLGVNSSVLGSMANPYISQKLELFYDGKPMTLGRDPNIGTDPLHTWLWAGYENMTVNNSEGPPGKRQPRGYQYMAATVPASEMSLPEYLDWLAEVPGAHAMQQQDSRGSVRHKQGDEETSFTFKDTYRGAMWAAAIREALSRNESEKLWLHGYWKFDWRDTYIQVESIEPDPNEQGAYTVTRAKSTPPQYPWISGCRFYATNALALVDEPGEYFVSKTSGDLYFIPPKSTEYPGVTHGHSSGTAVVSTLAQVIAASGASHTHFIGISVSISQADAVDLKDIPGVIVSNCTVANAGGTCLSVSGASNASVDNAVVFGCGNSGIAIQGGDLKTLKASNSSVVGSHIFDFARRRRTYQPGLAFHGVGMNFSNNTVRNAPHAGMTGGGNNLDFSFNVINHTVYECIDAGAFYVGRSWSQRGNSFRNNVIDTVRPTERLAQASCSQNGFYLDDEMSGWLFTGNTVINATTGVLLGGGRRNNISFNKFIDCDGDIHFDNRGMNWQQKSCQQNCSASMGTSCFYTSLKALNWQHPPYSTQYPEIVNIYEDHPCVPVHNTISGNTFCHVHSKAGGRFIDRDLATIESWGSSMINNNESKECPKSASE